MTGWPDRGDDLRASDVWSRACRVENRRHIILLQEVQLRFHYDSCNRKPALKGVFDVRLQVTDILTVLGDLCNHRNLVRISRHDLEVGKVQVALRPEATYSITQACICALINRPSTY